ncbi:hypothetical protein GW17_00058289, partial [Ensete ventricosum]
RVVKNFASLGDRFDRRLLCVCVFASFDGSRWNSMTTTGRLRGLHTIAFSSMRCLKLLFSVDSLLLVVLADLDDTLYPLSSGIATECRKNIGGTTTTAVSFGSFPCAVFWPVDFSSFPSFS